MLRELSARGVHSASLRVTRFDARGIALADVALGTELGAREVEVDLDPWAGASSMRRVRVAGLRLRLDLRPGATLLGEADAPLRLAAGELWAGSGAGALPALELADAEIALVREESEAALALSLQLGDPAADGSSPGRLELAARELALGGFGLDSAMLSLPFRLSISEQSISFSWNELARAEAKAASGPIQLSSERGRVDVELGEVPAVSPDVDLVLELPALEIPPARMPASRWRVALKGGALRADGSALGDRVRATLRATRDPAVAHVALGPVEFSPGGLQPGELDSRLAALRDVRGRIGADAELRWSDGKLRSSRAKLTIVSLGFRGASAAIEGLGGVIRLVSLSPLASAPAQTLSGTALQVAGIRFGKPHVRFDLAQDGVHVEEARLVLASGTIQVSDVRLDPASSSRDLQIRAADLELEQLLALAPMKGVAGSGRISGTLPVHVEGAALAIRGGLLESTGPGRLRIHSDRIRSALASAGATVEQLVLALEDFHYDTLRLELEKPAQGVSSARLHLLGRNPAVLEGRDFALNVNLETDLEPLLKVIGTGMQLTGEWSRLRR